ncbi:hypothetical protein C3F42_16250 [Pseudomonas sp. PONIH3]|nr:hypothetical protein C3F42_16250 [Pseudomonas sp. PONIH3]
MNGGALFNAEFGIRHSGSTVPERSGVALSFCRRHDLGPVHVDFFDSESPGCWIHAVPPALPGPG